MHRMTMPDNDVYFFRGQKDRKRCAACGQLTAKRQENIATTTIAKPPKFEVTCSVDGVVVVTKRVREALEVLFPGEIQIDSLQLGLFAILPRNVVLFDAVARKTRFEGQCEVCGQYQSIIGAKPIMLTAGSVVGPCDIARTDVEFGSDDEKAPLIVLGDQAAHALRAYGFSGCKILSA